MPRASLAPCLAIVLVVTLPSSVAAIAPPAAMPSMLDVRSDLVEDVLSLPRAAPVESWTRVAPALDVLIAFSQPIVKGRDDLMTVLWVRPFDAEWSGIYSVESSAGTVAPGKLTIDREGAFLSLEGGKLAHGTRTTVAYAFIGVDGRGWRHAFPPIAILDAVPLAGTVDFGGAARSAHAYPDLPQLALATVWNLHARAVEMGAALVDGEGIELATGAAGACAASECDLSEAGCRRAFLVPAASGASLVPWWSDLGGERVDGNAIRLDDLRGAPFVYATPKGASQALSLHVAPGAR
jgi:hypothetical protein